MSPLLTRYTQLLHAVAGKLVNVRTVGAMSCLRPTQSAKILEWSNFGEASISFALSLTTLFDLVLKKN